jgi:hypothetical protein
MTAMTARAEEAGNFSWSEKARILIFLSPRNPFCLAVCRRSWRFQFRDCLDRLKPNRQQATGNAAGTESDRPKTPLATTAGATKCRIRIWPLPVAGRLLPVACSDRSE